jgi:hypothetical protein
LLATVIGTVAVKLLVALSGDVSEAGSNGTAPGVGVEASPYWVDIVTSALRLTAECCSSGDAGVCVRAHTHT